MGLAYYGLGRSTPKYKTTAAQWLESALKGRPELALGDRTDAYFKLGELYNDINSAANAIRAFDNAIRLAEELEKQGGATHPKLVEAYYLLGDLYYKTGNCTAQKRSFERYIAREPDKNKVQYKAAQHALATSLQRC
jgi:tetratricopeptide (TPR) repeat protein